MKPLLGSLKNSEQMLKFMNDLSHFSELFSVLTPTQEKKPNAPPPKGSEENESQQKNCEKEKNPQSPTQGIADEFIERCLNNYFKNR